MTTNAHARPKPCATSTIAATPVNTPLGHAGGPIPAEYAGIAPLPLRQHWCDAMPVEQGHAFVAICDEGLRFYTWFEEQPPYTTARAHNQRLFELGSVAEFFIQPAGSAAYWEIHLSPNSLIMDIHIPNRDDLMAGRLDWDDLIAPGSQARYQVTTTTSAWSTEIILPWPCFERTAIPSGEDWGVGICRYNYPDRLVDPELSATAPFDQLSFHRTEEYHRLVFP
jgi:hypothetical protein